MQSVDPPPLPDSLLREVTLARPVCRFFGGRGCRKGAKCPRLHAGSNDKRLPYVSRFKAADGRDRLTIRPPIHEALQAYFEELQSPLTLASGMQSVMGSTDVITYQLVNMCPQDEAVCSEAAVGHGVVHECDGIRQWIGESSSALPQFLAHGTSVSNGLCICADGAIKPSPGICGNGVYGFKADPCTEVEALTTVWDRCVSGGYNSGCMIVYKPHGCLVNLAKKKGVDSVPAGTTAWSKE